MRPPSDLIARFEAAGQDHVFSHWDRLSEAERRALTSDLDAIDLEEFRGMRSVLDVPEAAIDPAKVEPLEQVKRYEDPGADARAAALGEQALKAGRVAAFVVAGGQGTRLGHPGPKGTYPATPIRQKPLFQLFAEKILARGRRAGRRIPWYVMTSPENHDDTLRFFEERAWFGLDRRDVMFFRQGTVPAVDASGRLLMATPSSVFRNPDGHGGSLKALRVSGALEDMAHRGVDTISYFQVDNPLVDVCDPVFVGYHLERESDFSSKALPKRDPGEKVGVLVRRDGRPAVIEYSDLPAELRDAREPGGQLRFRAGSIAIHVLRRQFVELLTSGGTHLPWHVARKDIPIVGADGAKSVVKGVKFETFVFDALPLTARTFVLEILRQEEFSPIKNKTGEDSADTARRDQVALFASWLEAAGVAVPRDAAGQPRHAIEIGPLFALDRDEAARKKERLPPAVDADLVLDEAP